MYKDSYFTFSIPLLPMPEQVERNGPAFVPLCPPLIPPPHHQQRSLNNTT